MSYKQWELVEVKREGAVFWHRFGATLIVTGSPGAWLLNGELTQDQKIYKILEVSEDYLVGVLAGGSKARGLASEAAYQLEQAKLQRARTKKQRENLARHTSRIVKDSKWKRENSRRETTKRAQVKFEFLQKELLENYKLIADNAALPPESIAGETGIIPLPLGNLKVSGIYFLVHKGQVVYVGQAVSIASRVVNHLQSDKIFDSAWFVVCKVEELDYVERTYIDRLMPKYNRDSITMARRRSV